MPSPNLAANFLSRAFYDILSPMKNITLTLVTAASLALSISAACGANDRPVLRIGAMSDNHLHADRTNTHVRTKACFDLFRRENVDIVVDTGDIVDRSDFAELAFFRTCFDASFRGTSCVPFFCIANHDYNYVKGTRFNDPRNIDSAWRALGMKGRNQSAVVKGYRFVNVFQHEADTNAFAEAVAKAVAESPAGRPVFVVNHVPPMFTTAGTVHWSSPAIRSVLNNYPQVVALTGHNHASLALPANIWQGEFTAINLGAHAEYSNKIAGEAAILDVFPDRIDIRRYEAVSGRELGADDRWSIPLPLDPKNGPYRPEHRAKTCPVASMPENAKARFEQNSHGNLGKLVFTSAEPRAIPTNYRLDIESQQPDGSWKFLTAYLDEEAPIQPEMPALLSAPLAPVLFDAGRPHRVKITPLNSHGVAGTSRTLPFTVPDQPMQQLPSDLLRIVRYQKDARKGARIITPDKDGWIEKKNAEIVAVLPKEFSAAIAGKKSVSLVFDVASEQNELPHTFSYGVLHADGHGEKQPGRIYSLPGRFDSCRYAFLIWAPKPEPGDQYFLTIREGRWGRFKINGVKAFVR